MYIQINLFVINLQQEERHLYLDEFPFDEQSIYLIRFINENLK
jgi:hypothetical protein